MQSWWILNMKAKLKIIFYYLIELFLSVLVLILGLGLLLKCTILNEKYLILKLEQNDYYNELYSSIKNDMENYLMQSGLPESVLENIYTKDMITKGVNNIIISFYNGNNLNVDTYTIEEHLKTNINTYLNNNNMQVSDQESLDQFVLEILKIYKEKIMLTDKLEDFQGTFTKWNFYLKVFLIILTIIILILGIFVKLCFKKDTFVIPLLTTAILLLVGNYLLFSRIDVSHILFWNESISEIIKSILWNMSSLVKYGAIFIIVFEFIVMIIFKSRKK